MSELNREDLEPIQPLTVEGLAALIEHARARVRQPSEFKQHVDRITEGGSFERYATRRRLSKSIESIGEVLRGVDGVPAMVVAGEANDLSAILRLAACLECRLAVLSEKIESEEDERKRAGFESSTGIGSLSDEFKRRILVEACKAFWISLNSLLDGPSGEYRQVDRCETAYWYCLSSNTLVPLYSRGLKYEQTMDGISWANDLPGQRESSDREGEVLIASGRRTDDASNTERAACDERALHGTFAARERIGGEVWRLNLTYGQNPTRLVLFTSFRGVKPEAWKPESLALAAARLRAWATKHRLDLDESAEAVWEVPTSTFRLFAESVDNWDKDEEGHPVLESAISHAMRLSPEPWCHVHWVQEINGKAWLKFRPLTYFAKGQPVTGPFEIPSPGEIAPLSVCAQSLGWNTPIFIPDMRVMTQSNVWWRDMDITCVNPHEPRQVRSQIACPVQLFGKPFASISLQHRHSSKLAAVHVRQLGILSELLTAMMELREESQAKPERWDGVTNWEWMKSNLCVSGDEPTTPADLLTRYFKRVRVVLGADLAYLIAYEYTRHAIGPLAVNASPRFCRDYLNVRLGKGSKLGSVDALRLIKDHDDESVFKSLVQRAMFSDLLPRRRGLSWRIAVGKHVAGVHERKVELQRSKTRTLARDLCEERIGVPFRSRASARPEGVLWVWWGRGEGGTITSQSDQRNSMERYDSDLERLGRVVATMYTLLRRRSDDVFESVAIPPDADR